MRKMAVSKTGAGNILDEPITSYWARKQRNAQRMMSKEHRKHSEGVPIGHIGDDLSNKINGLSNELSPTE